MTLDLTTAETFAAIEALEQQYKRAIRTMNDAQSGAAFDLAFMRAKPLRGAADKMTAAARAK